MVSSVRRLLEGDWRLNDLAAGTWRLDRVDASGDRLFVIGVPAAAAPHAADARVHRLEVEWLGPEVRVSFDTAAGRSSLTARTALLHEPRATAYDGLPLVHLDARARRFWRRVFRLVRLPGGRYLLRLVARRAR